jgi:WD40 repeat protein
LASFSPDGRRVVTASEDKTARLWDAATSQPLGQPMEHTGTVTSASFSPDGRRVITASLPSTAQLWEVDSGKLLATFQGHTSLA